MQGRVRRAHPIRKSALAFPALAPLALCAFQFGDRYGLNSMTVDKEKRGVEHEFSSIV
jgi:hypothetical protein